MGNVVIYGAGGFAREVHEIIESCVGWGDNNFLGFIDDNRENHGKEVHGAPILGGIQWLKEHQDVGIIVAIGSPYIKKKVINNIYKEISNPIFPSIIAESAKIGKRVKIGKGNIICDGCIVTTDIEIGDHVILNINTTVGHDAIIEDYVTTAPNVNISGNVLIKEGTDLGTNSVIIQGKTIGEWSIVGAGAVIVTDIPSNVTAVGMPAKVIKERESGWHL